MNVTTAAVALFSVIATSACVAIDNEPPRVFQTDAGKSSPATSDAWTNESPPVGEADSDEVEQPAPSRPETIDPDSPLTADSHRRRRADLARTLEAYRRLRTDLAHEREVYDSLDLTYNPELRDMGLKVGRDGLLHRIGPDARSPKDPDEGPVVPWSELQSKQFDR